MVPGTWHTRPLAARPRWRSPARPRPRPLAALPALARHRPAPWPARCPYPQAPGRYGSAYAQSLVQDPWCRRPAGFWDPVAYGAWFANVAWLKHGQTRVVAGCRRSSLPAGLRDAQLDRLVPGSDAAPAVGQPSASLAVSRSRTIAGTRPLTSPPNLAKSFTRLEDRNAYSGLVITNSVSTPAWL